MSEPTTALQPTVTQDQLQLVKTTVAQGATDAELKLFLFDCARQGVHPLDRLIHFTKRSSKYTPMTSIDFMRIRAAETGEYAGSDDVVFGEDKDGHPSTATVTVWRLVQGQRYAFTATARWAEYKPEQAFMWTKMPYTMLGKCAEALALRKGFPKQLAGLYAREEMDQAGHEDTAPTKQTQPTTTSTAPAFVPDPKVQELGITEAQQKRLFAILKQAGRDQETFKAWLFGTYGWTSTKQITRAAYDAIVSAVESPGALPGLDQDPVEEG